MKYLIKLFYLTAFIAAFAMFMRAEAPLTDGIDSELSQKSFLEAIKENKPVMVLVYSNTCYSSRVYMRNVINTASVQKNISSNFVCIKADIATREGRQFARKLNVVSLPAVFLMSSDKTMKYKSKLSLDSTILQNEMTNFRTCINIKEQIDLYRSTNNVSLKQAQITIAEYYSKHNLKKSSYSDPKTEVNSYTLGMKWFADFEKAYIEKRKVSAKTAK